MENLHPTPNFCSQNPFWLTFHWDSIFDQNSSNTHPNWVGQLSLCYRREILSYELKLIFLSFSQNVIICAWIWGCSAHVNQVWEFDKLWLTLGLQIKFKTHPYAHSSFQKDFTTCKFQVISLWPFTSPQAYNWWIFERS